MNHEKEQRIRERAHEMWEHAGRPEGESDRFWNTAEQELALDPASTMSMSHSGKPSAPEPTESVEPSTPYVKD
jgi:hypothetical protein